MSSIIYYDESPQSKYVRVLVYGEFGSGKTTFASTFPAPIFLDFDRGGRTLRDKHIPAIYFKDGRGFFQSVYKALIAMRDKEFDTDFDTVVFDSFSAMAEKILDEVMVTLPSGEKDQRTRNPLNEKPTWDNYSALLGRLVALNNITRDIDANIVSICGEKIDRDAETERLMGRPDIDGSYRKRIGRDYDEVYHLVQEGTGPTPRFMLYSGSHQYFAGKTREKMDYKIQDPSYSAIFGK